MDNITWLKQTKDAPLFPDILWSRPENKTQAGKLLIIGGNLHAFSSLASAYSQAMKLGAGTVRVVLPDKLKKVVGQILPEAIFAPSTLSGSFSRQTLALLLDEASWADGVLLAGDFGKNSETAILLEAFVEKYKGLLALSGDSIDDFIKHPEQITDRQQTLITASFSQLQKLLAGQVLLKHDMDLSRLVEDLVVFTKDADSMIITEHFGNNIVAYRGKVSTTHQAISVEQTAVASMVFSIQNRSKLFEAATSAIFELANS